MKIASSSLGAWFVAAAAFTSFVAGGTALAAEPHSGQKLWLACANGRDYPLRPLAVSRDGDIVTGYMLRTGTGRSIHLTLVPMGNGYRYAGPGVWFDGVRGDAALNWGAPNEIPCTVTQE